MRPISELQSEEAQRIEGLLFDLDDTLLDHGQLSRVAYDSLWDLVDRGISLVAVTGRPASWGQLLVRQWPIEGAVVENGALATSRDGRSIVLHDRCTPELRQARRTALQHIVHALRERWPELRASDDCDGRVSDFTFDIGENQRVAPDVVAAVARAAREQGARVVRSSVHLHVSLDVDDKATGALRFLHRTRGVAPSASPWCWAFIGDSENDSACFGAFHTTIGVANLRGRFSIGPRFRTEQPYGRGFAEAARVLIDRR